MKKPKAKVKREKPLRLSREEWALIHAALRFYNFSATLEIAEKIGREGQDAYRRGVAPGPNGQKIPDVLAYLRKTHAQYIKRERSRFFPRSKYRIREYRRIEEVK